MTDAVNTEWACNTPGGQVRLADLTLDALCLLEEQCGEEWWRIVAHPLRTAKAAKFIYAAACDTNGSVPERLTVRGLPDVFEQVPEDTPDFYEAGIPKAEGEAPTSGSPGAPSDSAGPPPKSDN